MSAKDLIWRVLTPAGKLVGATAWPEDAAALVSNVERGSVRYAGPGFGGRRAITVWREGEEASPAGESYDRAADTMMMRVREWSRP